MRYILCDDDLFGCLEYDLARYVNRDVRGLFTSPRTLTWRQVIVWIRHLPSDSALGRRGLVADRSWGTTEHLLASVVDTLRIVDWHYVSAHSTDGPPESPIMVRRPSDE